MPVLDVSGDLHLEIATVLSGGVWRGYKVDISDKWPHLGKASGEPWRRDFHIEKFPRF